MAVGYCTLYGDMNGCLTVISDVPRQLLYELSHFINREREIIPRPTITKAPTAGKERVSVGKRQHHPGRVEEK